MPDTTDFIILKSGPLYIKVDQTSETPLTVTVQKFNFSSI